MKIVLPYPVSANRYWRTVVAKRRRDGPGDKQRALTFVSEEAKAYKAECQWRARAAGFKPMSGTVELRIRLIPKNRVCMDLDNALKVTIDALKGIVYSDDANVYRIVAERADADPTGSRLEVEAMPFIPPDGLLFA